MPQETLTFKVLELLNQNEELRFSEICRQADPNAKSSSQKNLRSVKITAILKGMLKEELVTNECRKLQSWYNTTAKGKNEYQRQKDFAEIRAQVDCKIVSSSDNKAWASVYSGPINPFTGQTRTIVDQMKNAKINTIILHEGTPPKQEQPHKKD